MDLIAGVQRAVLRRRARQPADSPPHASRAPSSSLEKVEERALKNFDPCSASRFACRRIFSLSRTCTVRVTRCKYTIMWIMTYYAIISGQTRTLWGLFQVFRIKGLELRSPDQSSGSSPRQHYFLTMVDCFCANHQWCFCWCLNTESCFKYFVSRNCNLVPGTVIWFQEL